MLEVCERFGTRPQVLYVELFHHIIRLAPAMYPDEMVQVFQALVRLELQNPYLLKELHKFVLVHKNEFRFLHLCALQCCLTVLGQRVTSTNKSQPGMMSETEISDIIGYADVPAVLAERAKFETDVLSVEEMYECICKFASMEFSYRPFEELMWSSFLYRLEHEMPTAREIDQFADPFAVLRMLYGKDLLTPRIAQSFARWAYDASYRPNTLSQKRPNARDLVFLRTILELQPSVAHAPVEPTAACALDKKLTRIVMARRAEKISSTLRESDINPSCSTSSSTPLEVFSPSSSASSPSQHEPYSSSSTPGANELELFDRAEVPRWLEQKGGPSVASENPRGSIEDILAARAQSARIAAHSSSHEHDINSNASSPSSTTTRSVNERDPRIKRDGLTGKRLRAMGKVNNSSVLNHKRTAAELCALAVRNFVASRGGQQRTQLKKRPIQYQKGRLYWKLADACEGRKIAKVEASAAKAAFKDEKTASSARSEEMKGRVERKSIFHISASTTRRTAASSSSPRSASSRKSTSSTLYDSSSKSQGNGNISSTPVVAPADTRKAGCKDRTKIRSSFALLGKFSEYASNVSMTDKKAVTAQLLCMSSPFERFMAATERDAQAAAEVSIPPLKSSSSSSPLASEAAPAPSLSSDDSILESLLKRVAKEPRPGGATTDASGRRKMKPVQIEYANPLEAFLNNDPNGVPDRLTDDIRERSSFLSRTHLDRMAMPDHPALRYRRGSYILRRGPEATRQERNPLDILARARGQDHTATESALMWSFERQEFVAGQPLRRTYRQRVLHKQYNKRPYPAHVMGGEVDPILHRRLLVRPYMLGNLTTYYTTRRGPKRNMIQAK
ncbi:unnamed protein product [Amoebophrya sp. A25]|nr:unnamed protein product [Amoebophrya sp. A25]|eukprot:GSA25T00001022001.1